MGSRLHCLYFVHCSGAAAVAKAYPALMTYTRRMSYLLVDGRTGGFGGAVSSFQFDVAERCCLGHSVRFDRAAALGAPDRLRTPSPGTWVVSYWFQMVF